MGLNASSPVFGQARMMTSSVSCCDVLVLGAGISGLSCARGLHDAGLRVIVLEAAAVVGGKLQSQVDEVGRVFEAGPNTLYADQNLLDALARLRLTSKLRVASPLLHRRYLLKNGDYQALPGGPLGLFQSDFFSNTTKWRLLGEALHRSPAPATPETVAAFFRRRLGLEFTDYVINPMMAGIYAGDAERLMIDAVMPTLAAAERRSGSLTLGVLSLALRGRFSRKHTCTLEGGLAQLPQTLAEGLDVRLDSPAESLARDGEGWRVATPRGEIAARRVVLALPAYALAGLLAPLEPDWSQSLAAIAYPPMAVAQLVFDATQLGRKLDGFGALHPGVEAHVTSGVLWSSSLFPSRVPAGEVLLTAYLGGGRDTAVMALPQPEREARLLAEIDRLYRVTGRPKAVHWHDWPQALPHYDAALLAAARLGPALAAVGLPVCSNWLDGLSVPDCVAKGQALAWRLCAELRPLSS
jgi:oxygen-dependent protoporphyrinogen oxidase